MLRLVATGAAAVAAVAWSGALRDPAVYPQDTEGMSWALALGAKNIFANREELAKFTRGLYDADELPLKGHTAIVTGATRGLGEGIASHLFALGADLVLPCRKIPSDVRGDLASNAAKLRAEWGTIAGRKAPELGKVISVEMNMADLDSVDAAVKELARRGVKADWLVNNAGLNMPAVELTPQGFEMTLGVNHLATAHLTQLLLENKVLVASGKAKPKIVTVSSEEHRSSKRLNATEQAFGVPWGSGVLDAMDRYAYSKLAVTTWMLELARRRPDVILFDMCPGPVASDIAQGLGWVTEVVKWLMQLTFPTRFNAALPVVRLLASSAFDGLSGRHFHMAELRDARSDALDLEVGKRCFSDTQRLLQQRRP